MATAEQIERIAALLRQAHPAASLKKVNEAAEGLGADERFVSVHRLPEGGCVR